MSSKRTEACEVSILLFIIFKKICKITFTSCPVDFIANKIL